MPVTVAVSAALGVATTYSKSPGASAATTAVVAFFVPAVVAMGPLVATRVSTPPLVSLRRS